MWDLGMSAVRAGVNPLGQERSLSLAERQWFRCEKETSYFRDLKICNQAVALVRDGEQRFAAVPEPIGRYRTRQFHAEEAFRCPSCAVQIFGDALIVPLP